MGFELLRAAPSDRPAVVATIVAAFAADPAFRYFFPDDGSYAQHAGTFAAHLFDKRVAQGTVWITEGAAAAALWDPPAKESADLAVATPLDLPADALERIDRYDFAVHALLPDEPHWYLGVLATHPRHAGRRLGRRLMGAGVTTAHADGLPAVLETMSPSNVELYQREGWDVVGHTEGSVPTTWLLVNRPVVETEERVA